MRPALLPPPPSLLSPTANQLGQAQAPCPTMLSAALKGAGGARPPEAAPPAAFSESDAVHDYVINPRKRGNEVEVAFSSSLCTPRTRCARTRHPPRPRLRSARVRQGMRRCGEEREQWSRSA